MPVSETDIKKIHADLKAINEVYIDELKESQARYVDNLLERIKLLECRVRFLDEHTEFLLGKLGENVQHPSVRPDLDMNKIIGPGSKPYTLWPEPSITHRQYIRPTNVSDTEEDHF